MKRAILIAAALFALNAAAEEIRSYDVAIAVVSGGAARGTAKITIAGATAGEITIPLGFAASDVRLTSAPAGSSLTSEPFNAQTRMRLVLPEQTSGEVPVEISFSVAKALTEPEPAAGQKRVLPEGAYMLRHSLVATEATAIRGYRCVVSLPESLRVHAVREALPKPGKKEAEPRVQLGSVAGAPAATLQVAALRQGDDASMQLEVVPRARSPLWIAAGVLISLIYLIGFKDIVSRSADASGAPREARTTQE